MYGLGVEDFEVQGFRGLGFGFRGSPFDGPLVIGTFIGE